MWYSTVSINSLSICYLILSLVVFFTFTGFNLVNYKPNPDAPTCVVLDEAVTSGRMADIYNLKIHPEDIFVASFPKSGTTWLQQVVYLLLNDKNSQQGIIMA